MEGECVKMNLRGPKKRSLAVWGAGLLLTFSAVVALSGCLGVDSPDAVAVSPEPPDETEQISTFLPEPGLVSATQGYELLTALLGNPGFVLLDIRTAPEVEALHIPGAVNLDFYGDDFVDQLASLDRAKMYLIYCRTANRTGQAYGLMSDLEFAHVWDLDGGISAWSGLGYPTCQGALDDPHSCDGSFAAVQR